MLADAPPRRPSHACSATATSNASTLPPTAPLISTRKVSSLVRVVVTVACAAGCPLIQLRTAMQRKGQAQALLCLHRLPAGALIVCCIRACQQGSPTRLASKACADAMGDKGTGRKPTQACSA